MKKRFFSLLMALIVAIPVWADGILISANELPLSIQRFLSEYFPRNEILQIEKDWDEYEINMSDGILLEFDRAGRWKKIECVHSSTPVPAALLPDALNKYVQSSYPDAYIVTAEQDRRFIEVELSNDLDLKFTQKGKFLKIDD